MKRTLTYIALLAGGLAFALPAAAQDDFDVTMTVVPFADTLDPDNAIALPEDAAQEGRDASLFGRTVAGHAQAGGREFGQAVADEVRPDFVRDLGNETRELPERSLNLDARGGGP